MIECARSEREGLLDRRQNLYAARMTDDLVDVGERLAVTHEESVDGGAQLAPHQRRNVARKDRLESVLHHVPAHDVEGVGPGVLASRTETRTVARGRDDTGGGAVAE